MSKNNNENETLLSTYKNFIEFLTSVYGAQNEIVLFKVNPNNNEGFVISSTSDDYKIDDEIGGLLKKILYQSIKGYNYLINISDEAEQQKKMSYFLIRNSKNHVIGVFLIIFKISFMLDAKKVLDQILGFEAINNRPREYNDLYHELDQDGFSVGNYAKNIIKNVIAEYGIEPERLTSDEKTEIIQKLEKMDVFNIRGAVKETSKQLLISVPTVYRIMKR